MKINFLVFLTIISCLYCDSKLLQSKKKDDVLDLIERAGYEGEAHRVETDDGYLLKVHRIIPKVIECGSAKKPVFLMHGISATAADYLVTGRNVALAYLLADNGYDVWLGNARGSKHSMKHTNISSEAREFWNFSWHEIGYYDLATMIDYMLAETKSKQALYVGHSQGSTSLLVLLSSKPEYNEKLLQVHLMAPSAFRKKTPRIKTLTQILEYLVRIFFLRLCKDSCYEKLFVFQDSVDEYRYLDLTSILRFQAAVSKALCRRKSSLAKQLCNRIVLLVVGNGQKEVYIDTVSWISFLENCYLKKILL